MDSDTPCHVVAILDSKCKTCGSKIYFSTDRLAGDEVGFDSCFCKHCDVWLETGCGDPACYYCGDRPERPSLVTFPEVVSNPDAHA